MDTSPTVGDDIWSNLSEFFPYTFAIDFYAFGPKAMRLKIYKEKRHLDLNVSVQHLISSVPNGDTQSEFEILRLFPALHELNICFDVRVLDTHPINLPHLRVLTAPTSCAEAVLGKIVAPSLSTLRLFELALHPTSENKVPFYYDPQKMGILPHTLTRLDLPKLQTSLPGPISDRLPNSIASLNEVNIDFSILEKDMREHPACAVIADSSSEQNELDADALVSSSNVLITKENALRVNCSLDLSEITCIDAAAEAIELTKEELKKRILDESSALQNAMAIIYHVILPRTVDFYPDCVSASDAKVTEKVLFMKHVQKIYDMIGMDSSYFKKNLKSKEGDKKENKSEMAAISISTVVLLPCAPLKALPKMHLAVSLSMTQNHTSDDTVEAYERFFVPILKSQAASSTHQARLSLESFELCNTAAVGGTFDYLHTGHKALLSACLLTARKRLVIGIASQDLLLKKANKEYLQPFDTRKRNVTRFCALQRPDLFIDAIELLEPAGPTATDESIEVLVLSSETAPAFYAINKTREKNELPPMKSFVIELASSTSEMQNIAPSDAKVSSTTLRLRQKLIDNMITSPQN